jgi:electron transfer flavoprotein-quinone oxidoreductase
MKEEFDVAIVGAGPAGTSAACLLAEKGIKTVLFERISRLENMSGGVLYGHDLAVPRPTLSKEIALSSEALSNHACGTFRSAGYSVSSGTRSFMTDGLSMRSPWKSQFDRWFAAQAAVWARCRTGTVVTDLLRTGDGRVAECGPTGRMAM